MATDTLRHKYMNRLASKMFKLNLQTDLFSKITFPLVPWNFKMMMSDIPYPEKAKADKQNGGSINGTLVMKPSEIDQNDADDLAKQCFGGDQFTQKNHMSLKGTSNMGASIPSKEEKELTDGGSFFESISNPAKNLVSFIEETALINTVLNEAEIEIPSMVDRHKEMEKYTGDVIGAINNYVAKSVVAITPLIEMVCGDRSSSSLQKIRKSINTANRASYQSIRVWLDDNDNALKSWKNDSMRQENTAMTKQIDAMKDASDFYTYIIRHMSDSDRHNCNFQKLQRSIMGVTTKSQLDEIVHTYTDYDTYSEFERQVERRNPIDIKNLPKNNVNSAVEEPRHTFFLNEANGDDLKPEIGDLDYDVICEDLFNTLTDAMAEVINVRSEWTCIKDVANGMKILKDRADEEIKKKIEIICKTGANVKSLVKHPFKAEGLLTMWSRYSDDLQRRIDARVGQLTGSNGKESGSAALVEEFLKVTYPRILAVVITYKCMFMQIREFFSNGYVPVYTLDELNEYVASADDVFSGCLNDVIETYDAM